MQVKITKRQIDALAPGSIIADEEVKGFVARRLRTGAVSYGFRYRDKKTGKQRWIGLGLHGSITPDQARNLAKKRAGEVADARDPAGERDATRAEAVKAKLAEVNTVNAVLDNFSKGVRSRVRRLAQCRPSRAGVQSVCTSSDRRQINLRPSAFRHQNYASPRRREL